MITGVFSIEIALDANNKLAFIDGSIARFIESHHNY